MGNILDRIVADKYKHVADAKNLLPADQLIDLARPTESPFQFARAMTRANTQVRVIAEFKRASPSAGLIRPDLAPAQVAEIYQQHGATAISCLTDAPYFQGSLTDLTAICQAVDLPVMRKEFIIDPYQVYEARYAGAQGVLLIAECLDDATCRQCLTVAESLGMSCLLEIHQPEQLDRALTQLAEFPNDHHLLGINNRDLTRMVTDLEHTLKLLDRVPEPNRLVSESGIRDHDQIRRLQQVGVNSVLVGEHLMAQPDIGSALEALIGNP